MRRLARSSRDEGPLAALLTLGGVTAAAAMMAVGLARIPWVDHAADVVPRAPGELLDGVLATDPAAWTAAGCVVLMATPFLRVLLLAGAFARRGRVAFALASLGVLGILAAAVALA